MDLTLNEFLSHMSFDQLREVCEFFFRFLVLTFITLIVSAGCHGYFIEVLAYYVCFYVYFLKLLPCLYYKLLSR